MLSCSIRFSAPSFWMGGGLESRCLGRVYGADGAVHHIAVGAPTPLSSHFITNVNHPDAVTVIAGGGGS